MTHLDISEDLATEIAAARHNIVTAIPENPDADAILRRVVEGVFPYGIEDAVAGHVGGSEQSAIVDLIAGLTVAIERGVTR